MPVIDLYSRRKADAAGSADDVYIYDSLSETLRTQVRRVFEAAIGPYIIYSGYGEPPRRNNGSWNTIREVVAQELGLLTLTGERNPFDDCMFFLHNHPNTDQVLDLIEFTLMFIDDRMRKLSSLDWQRTGAKQKPAEAIEEFNIRCRQDSVGYRYEAGQIIRVDSEFVHAEVMKPALLLLTDSRFRGPQEEFLSAHAHYRAGENKQAIAGALNAFESTMKTICGIKGWEVPKGARASDIIKVIKGNGLFPDYLDGAFDNLIATLQSGLPKVRNDAGGHGQGAVPKEVPSYVAAYALHLCAAKIVLLVDALAAME